MCSKLMCYKKQFLALLFSVIAILLILNCNLTSTSPDEENQAFDEFKDADPYIITNFNVNEMPWDKYPLTVIYQVPLTGRALDENGVVLFEHNGIYYYHSLKIAIIIIRYLDCYRAYGNEEYLTSAIPNIEKLIELGEEIDGALFYPYPFEWILHNNPRDHFDPPWVSGIAQAYILGAFIRYYNLTNDEKYLDIARKVFRSFQLLKTGHHKYWIARIDDRGYYWVEEAPLGNGTRILNGFMDAIFGLYEYYMTTKDELCLRMIRAALTTLNTHVYEYKTGFISYYCLEHKIAYGNYHMRHIEQLDIMGKIIDFKLYKELSQSFYNDYHQ